jgi:phospholipid-translocating ATPase
VRIGDHAVKPTPPKLTGFPLRELQLLGPNTVTNQKYNAFVLLPIGLHEQFKFFLNLYFLLVALS